jgi:hypothetical protein
MKNKSAEVQFHRIGRKRGSPVLNSWSRISVNLTSLDVLTALRLHRMRLHREWIENPNDLKVQAPGLGSYT